MVTTTATAMPSILSQGPSLMVGKADGSDGTRHGSRYTPLNTTASVCCVRPCRGRHGRLDRPPLALTRSVGKGVRVLDFDSESGLECCQQLDRPEPYSIRRADVGSLGSWAN